MLSRKNSQSVFTAPVVVAVMSKLSVAVFKTINKWWCNVSCDKMLERDWTALYGTAGHGLYTQFNRSFPFFLVEVSLACKTISDP